MTQEALKLALEFIENSECGTADLEARIKEALAQTQEPIGYLCENAVGHRYFRWKKPPSTYKPIALYTTPPQRTERPVDCGRCNRLEEQAYDLVGKLRVANIKLSMQPQRTWVGLTDGEYKELHLQMGPVYYYQEYGQAIEAKLKEKNNAT